MPVGNELRKFRLKQGLSQEAVGEVTYNHQKVISQIERGERLPDPSFLNRLASLYPSAVGFKAQAVYEERSEFFSVPLLNEVDPHIQTSLDVIIEEYTEGIRAARELKQLCRNLMDYHKVLDDTRIRIMALLGQIVDTYTANKVLLCTMAETYHIPIDELEARHVAKLRERGYYSSGGKEYLGGQIND